MYVSRGGIKSIVWRIVRGKWRSVGGVGMRRVDSRLVLLVVVLELWENGRTLWRVVCERPA
jgi:hypothetical protein